MELFYIMDKHRKPIVEALQQFQQHDPISFHVPGHKNGMLSTLPNSYKDALRFDMTELKTLDDLHYPEECIAEAQALLTNTYNADASFFLVNGSTIGNLAMIYATCKAGDVVLVQRNAHKSIFHGLELVGATAVLLAPQWDESTKTASYVALHTLKQAIAGYPNARAVIITSPTYYGVISPELEQFISYAHMQHIPVLVDEAHGAHFQAHAELPTSALQLGADVVVQSAHKTLNAMTMASFLHVRSDIIASTAVAKYLRMLQSSSPSYMLLASLDDAHHFVATYTDQDYAYMMQQRETFIMALKDIQHVTPIAVHDPLKLVIRIEGYDGFTIKEALEQQYVFVELADNEQVLLVLPLLKKSQQYRYDEAIEAITRAVQALLLKPYTYKELPYYNYTAPVTEVLMTEATRELVYFEAAINRKSAENIVPYPPGIPLLVRGECITATHIEAILQYDALRCPIQGEHHIATKQLYVMKE